MFDHIGIVVADLAASRALYTSILAPLGYEVLQDNVQGDNQGWLVFGTEPEAPFFVVGAGRPSFWSVESEPSRTPIHSAFVAPSKAAVDQFHAAGLDAGAADNGAPGERRPGYYAAYLLDYDGNNIEAAFRAVDETPAGKRK